MLQRLNRLKNKKGFTLVELIVVIAVIAIITAIMLVNLIGGNTDKQLAAKTNAQTFFNAAQLAMTRAHLTEREIVSYDPADTKFIEYKDGINTTGGKYLFIEAKFAQSGIVGIHIQNYLDTLMSQPDITAGSGTALEKYLATNLDKYLSDSYDGYFYAMVDEDFKVLFTHYCAVRLPVCSGGAAALQNELLIYNSKVKKTNQYLGTCSDEFIIPPDNYHYAFNAPNPGLGSPADKYYAP